ncbi:1-O-acylceramide synthase precursor [Perkinsela sp. CCAP 1560/4]|nr:1-O-acylceramide synthase precursor [Perkinsela sp. CCAP 1560/4]|eukprot:KNH08323.1 1-O-acylceramide synthase precursor [Perkinsela sp. CCAP 1560/4]
MMHISSVVLLFSTLLVAGGSATETIQPDMTSKYKQSSNDSLNGTKETARSVTQTSNSQNSSKNKSAKTSRKPIAENNSDLFSFMELSFREKSLRFINDNPKLLDYFPVGVRQAIIKGLQPDAQNNGATFVKKFQETYNDLMNILPDFSGITSATSTHAAKMVYGDACLDATVSETLCSKERLTPILFVPGLLGSALEERRSNATWLPSECYCSSSPGNEWSRSWVSVASFLGYRCWREVLKLSIRDATGPMEPERPSMDVKDLDSTSQWKTGSATSAVKAFFSAVKSLFAPKSANTVDSLEYEVMQYPQELPGSLAKAQSIGEYDFSQSFMRAKFPAGIEVRPVADGIEATRCLDSSNSWTCQTTSYFKELLDYMTRKPAVPTPTEAIRNGFTQGPDTAQSIQCPQYVLRHNIDVVPFDFRLGGYELYHSMESTGAYGGFFEQVKQKVEKLYAASGEKVAMVTHSLGGPLTVAFVNTYVDEAWKSKYIKKIVTIAAPFGGAVKAMQAALIGGTESRLVPAWSAQAMLSSWPGLYMVFPTEPTQAERAAKQPGVLVEVRESAEPNAQSTVSVSLLDRALAGIRSVLFHPLLNTVRDSGDLKGPNAQRYSANQLPQVIRSHPNVASIYADHLERLRPLFDVFRRPPRDVDIDCIYSTGIQTTKKLIYQTLNANDVFSPQIVTDDHGDGTVRTESLALCRTWETDADIDVDMLSEERVNLLERFAKAQAPRRKSGPVRRTIELAGVNHVDIISSTPEVWDFILQSVNSG